MSLFFFSREENASASHQEHSERSPTPCFSPVKCPGIRERMGLPEAWEHSCSPVRRQASSACWEFPQLLPRPGWDSFKAGTTAGSVYKSTDVSLLLYLAGIWPPTVCFLFLTLQLDLVQEGRAEVTKWVCLEKTVTRHDLVGPYGEMGASGSAYVDRLG